MNKRLAFAFAAALVLGAGGMANAQTAEDKAIVDASKAKGVVGETGEGLLAFVSASSDASVKAAVDHINAGRMEAYRAAAAKAGVSPDAAAQAAAQQVYARLPSGAWYRPIGGAWTRKP